MIGAADGFATLVAVARAFVLGQVVIEAGETGKRPVAHRAVDAWVEFVVVAEHRGMNWPDYFLGCGMILMMV